MNKNSLRPGVYSSYNVTSRYATPRSKKSAALVCKSSVSIGNSLKRISNIQQAEEVFVNDKAFLECCKILLETGVSSIVLSKVFSGDYYNATRALKPYKDVAVVISDAEQQDEFSETLNGVVKNSEEQCEQICMFGAKTRLPASIAAKALNHERAVVCAPELSYKENAHYLYSACAFAAAILVQNNPIYNFNGHILENLTLKEPLPESSVQELIASGVTVFEPVGEDVECVRAVSSKTMSGENPDLSMRSINTILIIDDVISTIRTSLANRLKGEHISTTSQDSIASQVMVELNAKKNEGLLEGFEAPLVYTHDSDPAICVVELVFTIAHVISQIHITAHIQL